LVTTGLARPPEVRTRRAFRPRSGPPRPVFIAAAVLVLCGAATFSAYNVDTDSGNDLAALASRVGADCLHLRWQYVLVVVALGAAHYGATAIAAKAASGLPLGLRETTLVQLVAAAANRLTPGGVGGSAVNARYFARRGLDVRTAVGAVAVLAVLGALADLAVFAILVLGGQLLGLGAGGHELEQLWAKLSAPASRLHSRWIWAIVAATIVALALARTILRRRGTRPDWRRLLEPVAALSHHPRRLLALLTASGSTTLILAFAFAASAAMVPGPQPREQLGSLLVAFMAGAATGSAVPVPAGLGSTELALTGVLLAAGVPLAHAVEVVLIFRLITFWLPAVAGVLATRHLHRRSAL
jgi:uncharacterized membrane protein YbhN (UPF0104 family)